MNAPVTRRAMLGASSAAIGAVALPALTEAGIPVSGAADPDAGLIYLIRRHAEAEDDLRRAEDEVDRLSLTAAASYPPHPDALVWRPTDFPRTTFGRGASDEPDFDGRCRYRERGVEWLRRLDPPSIWTATCEARRHEIVETWDVWRAAHDEIDARLGLAAADAAVKRADETLAILTRTILTTAPTTLAGLAVKARWAVPDHVPDSAATAWRLRQVMNDVVAMAGRSEGVS